MWNEQSDENKKSGGASHRKEIANDIQIKCCSSETCMLIMVYEGLLSQKFDNIEEYLNIA